MNLILGENEIFRQSGCKCLSPDSESFFYPFFFKLIDDQYDQYH